MKSACPVTPDAGPAPVSPTLSGACSAPFNANLVVPQPDPLAEQIRRGRGEVARMIGLMTPHNVEPKAEVGVRELHDQLSRYLHHVSSGAEVVVTVRGRRVARLSGVGAADPLEDLRARGLVLDPQHSRRPMAGHVRLAAVGSVSDLVSEQRR